MKNIFRRNTALISLILLVSSCSVQKRIGRIAGQGLLEDTVIKHAHIGISIYDVGSGKYLYDYQGDKYFVPASNTKIITCYAGMKYLGDSIAGMRYFENDTAIFLQPTGDPTFLHSGYKWQPVADFITATQKPLYINDKNWNEKALGSGWSWDDYNDYYMPERSALPVYGNVIRWVQEKTGDSPQQDTVFDQSVSIYSIPEISWDVHFNPASNDRHFYVERKKDANDFVITQGSEKKREQEVPFVTNGMLSALELIKENYGKEIIRDTGFIPDPAKLKVIYSRPVDSVLQPMMHRSDNFFAEQILLMVAERLTGTLNDRKAIDSLLNGDLSGMPQRPAWADGSGLSRFNLFSPQDFIFVLNRMRQEFGMDHVKNIFETGGNGTLRNYYKDMNDHIYAKTGTLTGVVALSGFLTTRKNRQLLFSILVNNHNGSTVAIRRKVESFIRRIYDNY